MQKIKQIYFKLLALNRNSKILREETQEELYYKKKSRKINRNKNKREKK